MKYGCRGTGSLDNVIQYADTIVCLIYAVMIEILIHDL